MCLTVQIAFLETNQNRIASVPYFHFYCCDCLLVALEEEVGQCCTDSLLAHSPFFMGNEAVAR